MRKSRLLALIPARGGSKGIPRKNLQEVGNQSLLERTIHKANDSGLFDEICVSTDDQEIAQNAKDLGAKVPFCRPPELSSDSATSFAVIQHAIKHYELLGMTFDYLTLLQPTTPFRRSEDLRIAHEAFKKSNCATLISVMDASPFHQSTLYSINEKIDNRLAIVRPHSASIQSKVGKPRQSFDKRLWRNGSIYIFRPKILFEKQALINDPIMSFEMDWLYSINIDEPRDLEQARLLAQALQI
jgi:CMP-N-acetylneuraminic acid synthetase